MTSLPTIFLVAFCALLGAIGQIFFKLGSKDFRLDLFSMITNWELFTGLAFYGIATLLFVYSLKNNNLSILYPIIASSYIWVTIFSMVFLGEQFALYKWIGILMIIGGITIISI